MDILAARCHAEEWMAIHTTKLLQYERQYFACTETVEWTGDGDVKYKLIGDGDVADEGTGNGDVADKGTGDGDAADEGTGNGGR